MIDEVADLIDRHVHGPVTRVAVDGIDGAGKTTFADELAGVLRDRGQTAIRASADGFHNPREIRYRRGCHSPVGYYLDSFDYDRLRRVLLDPLSPGGSGRHVPAVHDVASEQNLDIEPRQAAVGSVLVFDGIFAHRPELAGYWDCSVFLKVDRSVAVERMRRRDGAVDASVVDSRYGEGQRLYLGACRPSELATIVIDNNVLDQPSSFDEPEAVVTAQSVAIVAALSHTDMYDSQGWPQGAGRHPERPPRRARHRAWR